MSHCLVRALPLAAGALLAFAPLAHAEVVKFSGTFAPEGQSASSGKGDLSGSVDTDTNKVTYKITYSGLTGKVVAAHFHGSAAPGQNAPPMLPIPAPYDSGTLQANDATVKALLAGLTYVNLHTEKYPGGEIRAQVIPEKGAM